MKNFVLLFTLLGCTFVSATASTTLHTHLLGNPQIVYQSGTNHVTLLTFSITNDSTATEAVTLQGISISTSSSTGAAAFYYPGIVDENGTPICITNTPLGLGATTFTFQKILQPGQTDTFKLQSGVYYSCSTFFNFITLDQVMATGQQSGLSIQSDGLPTLAQTIGISYMEEYLQITSPDFAICQNQLFYFWIEGVSKWCTSGIITWDFGPHAHIQQWQSQTNPYNYFTEPGLQTITATVVDPVTGAVFVIMKNILVYPAPEITVVADQNNCKLLINSLGTWMTYNWLLNGQVIVQNTSSNNLMASGTGLYQVQALNEFGCTTYSEPIFMDCAPNAISETETVSEVTLFPNPATATLQLQTTEPIETVTLSDITGKRIQTSVVNTDHFECDVSSLPNGLYLLTGKTPGGKTFSKRFTKQ